MVNLMGFEGFILFMVSIQITKFLIGLGDFEERLSNKK